MFQEFVKQIKRVFSSKNNAGKQVYNLPDKLHYLKLLVFALSITILFGYTQFRENFDCLATEGADKKFMKAFCWTNGTGTIDVASSAGQQRRPASEAHVGMDFKLDSDRYKEISHNYMRSIWLLLLLMVICSYVAQRLWSGIFNNETLKILLELPGYDELALAKRVRELRPCDTLKRVSSSACASLVAAKGAHAQGRPQVAISKLHGTGKENEADGKKDASAATSLSRLQPDATGAPTRAPPQATAKGHQELTCAGLHLFIGDENEYNHTLDHYADQLVYLLMAIKTSAYKLLGLKLRRKLYQHAILSLALSCLQFVLPVFFVGLEYVGYGSSYFQALLHFIAQLLGRADITASSIDYQLSARLWPTVAKCTIQLNAVNGKVDRRSVTCSLPLNEIAAKLFAILWWLMLVGLVVDLVHLALLVGRTLSLGLIRRHFGNFWPGARQEADYLATFRFRQARLLRHDQADASERKRLEAQLDTRGSHRAALRKPPNNRCFLLNPRLDLKGDTSFISACYQGAPETGSRPAGFEPDQQGYAASHDYMDVYFLLYLLYLRLGKSTSKVEQVIRISAHALQANERFLIACNKLAEAAENTPEVHANPQAERAGANASQVRVDSS